jgi:hypothetical protein
LAGELYRASQGVGEEDLPLMTLGLQDLPPLIRDFEVARDGVLDNATMSEQGFPGTTTEETNATGRITGFLREFAAVVDSSNLTPVPQVGADFIAGTVVHLFGDGDQVSRWMELNFVGEFQRQVGKDLGGELKLLAAEPVDFPGFSDTSAGMRTLQTTPIGPVSSTIVDFRMGRILGVAYLVSMGDVLRKDEVRQLGIELERKIVRVLLGAI